MSETYKPMDQNLSGAYSRNTVSSQFVKYAHSRYTRKPEAGPTGAGAQSIRKSTKTRITRPKLTLAIASDISERNITIVRALQLTIAKLPLAKDLDGFQFEGAPINQALVKASSPPSS